MRPLFIFTGSIAVSMLLAFCIPQQQHDDRKAENCTASKQGNDLFVAFYNVENLFDTTDDPGIDDAEFLPTAKNPWTNDKYKTKVSNIARVIRTMNDGDGADIVGLENSNWSHSSPALIGPFRKSWSTRRRVGSASALKTWLMIR